MRKPSSATAIAGVALFFSLAGTSVAASHYLITSTTQIKPSVLAQLRGRTGPAGAVGPTGAPGNAGAAGAAGQTGATGPTGPGAPDAVYAGRVVVAVGASSTTFLTIPGIAHVRTFSCSTSPNDATAELVNDSDNTTDMWDLNDSTYASVNWASTISAPATTYGEVWHLGVGSGTGAQVITITISVEDTGSECIFQGTAEEATAP